MPFEKANGIVIRLQDYSETSQIATFLTDSAGKLAAIAKGSKRAKSATGGALDMLTLNEIVFSPSPSGGLATLREARTVEQFAGLRAQTAIYYAGLYAAELASIFVEGSEGQPQHFELLASCLKALSCRKADVDIVLAHFESHLLAAVGLALNLETCARCGARSDAARLSIEDGGVLCRSCSGGAHMTRAGIATLKRVFEGTLNGLARLKLTSAVRSEACGALAALVLYNAHRVPRMMAYVRPDWRRHATRWLPPRLEPT